MEATTCPECGVSLPAGLTRCSHCGAAVPEPTAPPQPPPVAPPILPSTSEALDLNTLVEAGSRPPAPVVRRVQASVRLDIPQAAVDEQGWLRPEEWAALLAAWDKAVEAHMTREMEQGRMVAADLAGVAVPWERVPNSLTPPQRQELEQALRGLFANLPRAGAPNLASGADVTVQVVNRSTKAGCSTPLLVLLLVLLWVSAHWAGLLSMNLRTG
jgi:hypothetical protein